MRARRLGVVDGAELFDVEGAVYALLDVGPSDWPGLERWRGVRVVRLPGFEGTPAETRLRYASVLVRPSGAVAAKTEGDRWWHEKGEGPEPLAPERTWLERERAAYEAEDSERRMGDG